MLTAETYYILEFDLSQFYMNLTLRFPIHGSWKCHIMLGFIGFRVWFSAAGVEEPFWEIRIFPQARLV